MFGFNRGVCRIVNHEKDRIINLKANNRRRTLSNRVQSYIYTVSRYEVYYLPTLCTLAERPFYEMTKRVGTQQFMKHYTNTTKGERELVGRKMIVI